MITTRLVPFNICHCHREIDVCCASINSTINVPFCEHSTEMLPLAKKEIADCSRNPDVKESCWYIYSVTMSVLQSFILFASIFIEVNVFLKTVSKQQSPTQRQTSHQDFGIYPNSPALSTCVLSNIF